MFDSLTNPISTTLHKNLKEIPELRKVFDWLKSNNKAVQIYSNFSRLINTIFDITKDDIDFISNCHERMKQRGVQINSASSINCPNFLRKVKEAGEELREVVAEGLSFQSENSEKALKELARLMKNGSEAASVSDSIPKDGDARWDDLIWGHTQAKEDVSPEVLLYFSLSHYFAQYLNITLGTEYGLEQKDDFLNVLMDLVLLDKVKTDQQFEEVFEIFVTTRHSGGLEWLIVGQVDVYTEVARNEVI